MDEKSPFLWIFAVIVALLLGAGGGYWYGSKVGFDKGEVATKAAVEAEDKKAAEAANPFSNKETNPLDKVTTNPFESVKINPFK